jgi:hypothetical protein
VISHFLMLTSGVGVSRCAWLFVIWEGAPKRLFFRDFEQASPERLDPRLRFRRSPCYNCQAIRVAIEDCATRQCEVNA